MKRRHIQPLIDALAKIEGPACTALGAQTVTDTPALADIAEAIRKIAVDSRHLMTTLAAFRSSLPIEKGTAGRDPERP